MSSDYGTARTLSLAMLSLAFVSVSFASEYADHLDQILAARAQYTGCWMAEDPAHATPVDAATASPISDDWTMRFEQGTDFQYVRCYNCPPPASWTVFEDSLEHLKRDTDFAEKLRAKAEGVAGKGPAKETCQQSYARIEEALLERPVEIPLVSVKVTAFWAQLATALLMVVLLVEIRASIRVALRTQVRGDRWTAIDDETTAERIVAVAWVLALIAAPFLVDVCFVATFTGYLRAIGSATPLVADGLIVLGVGALFVVSGWLVYSLLLDLLVLRAQRRTPPAGGDPPAPALSDGSPATGSAPA